MNMIFERKLPIPKDVKELYPLSGELSEIVENRAKEIFKGLQPVRKFLAGT